MKTTASPTAKKVINFLLICFTSIYLTFLVDIYTLNTTLKKVFVFGYFVIMCALFLYLKNRFLKRNSGKTISALYRIVIIVFSISVLAVFQNTFLPLTRSNIITMCAEGNGEVWLVEAEADGKSIPLSQLSVQDKYNWEYSADYDDYVYYPGEEPKDNGLAVEIAGQDIKLRFGANSWSGSVLVTNSEGNTETLELYSEEEGAYEYSDSGVRQYTTAERVLFNLGAVILLVFVFDSISAILLRNKKTDGCVFKAHFDIVFLTLGILLTIVTVAVFMPRVFFEGKDFTVTITSLSDRNTDCEGYEMEFSLTANGRSVSPERSDSGWTKFGDYFFCNVQDQSVTFELNSVDENEINFAHHRYAAKIRVDYQEDSKVVDLYSPNERTEKWTLDQEYYLKSPLEILLRIIVIGTVFLFLFLLMAHNCNNVRTAVLFCQLILFAILFSRSVLPPYQYYVIFVVSLFGYCHIYANKGKYIRDYLSKKTKTTIAATIFLCAYTAFALFGYDIFLSETFWNIGAKSIISYLHFVMIVFPIVLLCLEVLERAKEAITKNVIRKGLKNEDKGFHIKAFLVLAIPMIISCIIFYPANITSDQVDQWIQALGYISIADAHPAIHTLFLRLCSKIYPSPVTVTIIQSILLAFIISTILNKCCQKGIPGRFLLGIAALYAVIPSTLAMITSITKNIMFAILMLWTVYLLMEVFDNPVHFFKSPIYVVQSLIVLPFVHMVRHNAFVVLPIVAVVLIYCTIKYFKEIHIRPILLLIGMILTITFVKGPVYEYFNVVSSGNMMLPPLTPYTVALKYEVPLSDDTMEFLEKILPKDEFIKRYSPYNSDVFSWSSPRPDYSEITTAEALKYYFKLLYQRPDIIIKERLDGTNLIWDVFSHPGVNHDRYAFGIWGNPNLVEYTKMEPRTFIPERRVSEIVYRAGSSFVTEAVTKYITMFDEFTISDCILWRNGIYVILMLIVGVFALKQKTYRVLVLESVPLAVLCTLLLVIGWQIYQYVWFFPISICLICLYALICKSTEKI